MQRAHLLCIDLFLFFCVSLVRLLGANYLQKTICPQRMFAIKKLMPRGQRKSDVERCARVLRRRLIEAHPFAQRGGQMETGQDYHSKKKAAP